MTASTPIQRLTVKVADAAKMLGVSTKTIDRAIERGELHVNRKFRCRLILVSDLERLARA